MGREMLGVFDVGGEGFDDGWKVGVDVRRDTFSGGGEGVSLNRISFTPLLRNPASGCVSSMTFSFFGPMDPTPSPSSLNASTDAIPSNSPSTPPNPKSRFWTSIYV